MGVKYLIKVYLWTVVVFIIAKIGFMFFCREGHDFSIGDVWQVILHGLSLDLSTALYVVIIPFLIAIISVWWTVPMILLRGYFAVISIVLALAFVADTSLYPFWGFKLDASCLMYLSTPGEAAASVSTWYLIVRLLAIFIIVAIIFWGYRNHGDCPRVFRKLHTQETVPLISWRHRIAETVLYLFCIPLMVIGMRGGIDESTTNIGQVYYSQNQFLNHSAVNPVFNFLYSLDHQLSNDNNYQFMEQSECEELLKDIYTTESIDTDSLLNTKRPDIVIILLESCGEQFSKVMPKLQKLKQEGIWFSQCYGNSWRTDRGTVCILSGYPSFPSLSVMKMPEKSRSLPSIAGTLRKEGYQTSFLYGGDINFTNMRSYLIATGWETLKWKKDFTREEQKTSEWGVRDDITLATLYNQITQLPTDTLRQERALIGYSTLSSHEPWDVPVKHLGDEVLNAFSYLDDCLGNFIDKLKQTPQWRNLLIVMVADHGINYKDVDEQQPLLRNHIPLMMVGGAVKEPRIITTLCNQTDICATLLGQLSLPHNDFRFSRDVLSKSYLHPTAVHNYNNAQLLVDSTGYILYDFDASRFAVSKCTDEDQLLRINKAILQTTSDDLNQR